MIRYITDKEQKRDIAAEVLGNLTEWFGLPESTKEWDSGSWKCFQIFGMLGIPARFM